MPKPAPRRTDWERRLATPGWSLLPLRAFLGGTFVYAGLQKLADRNFFRSSSASSIQAQMHAYSHHSPIGGLLGGAAHDAVLLGLAIALAELAVGLGALLGIWTRQAAIGGALLSLGFLLTVSWHSRPYYYGADIVFLVAWLPLAIVGDGGVLSLAAILRERERKLLGAPVTGPVNIEFGTVQRMCGAYDKGACTLRGDRPCEPQPCPVLRSGGRAPAATAADLDRRAFLATARTAGMIAAGAAAFGGLVAAAGRIAPTAAASRALGGDTLPTLGGRSSAAGRTEATTTASTATTAPGSTGTTGSTPIEGPTIPTTASVPAGTPVGPISSVPKGGAARFTDPASGEPAYVLRSSSGDVTAFSAVCTHAGCTVAYTGSDFACPCHGARFSASDGSAVQGPANRPLSTITVHIGTDGQLYVDG